MVENKISDAEVVPNKLCCLTNSISYIHQPMMKLKCFSLCFAGLNKIFKERGITAQTIEVGALFVCFLQAASFP